MVWNLRIRGMDVMVTATVTVMVTATVTVPMNKQKINVRFFL